MEIIMSANVTDATFQSQVLDASKNKPVLVKFSAIWCGPCRAMAPILDDISKDYSDKINIFELDTDENIKTASAYNITSIPTMMVFVDGIVVKTIIGAKPKAALKTDLASWIG